MMNWFDVIQAIISGITVAVVIYWLDERRAKRDRQLSDFRIASNWFQNEPKVSLRSFDLTKRNLSSYKLMGANLEETIFTNSKMWATNFGGANLRHTDFRKTELVGVKFNKAIMIRCNFSDSNIKARNDPDYIYVPDFSESTLVYVKFIGARLNGAIFTNANLKSSDFSRAIVTDCDFSGADLTNSNWRRVRLVEKCIWKGVKIDNRSNFPEYLWEEIQEQNVKSVKSKRSTK